MFNRSYDVHGLRLAISATREALFSAVDKYLKSFICAADVEASDFRISLRDGLYENSGQSLPVIFAGTISPDVPCHLSGDASKSLLIVPHQCSVFCDGPARRIVIDVEEFANDACLDLAVIHALDTLFSHSGWQMLHAAALTLPNMADQAIAIFGESGRGKTTTALSMALNGFSLLSDDAVIIEERAGVNGEARRLWGLPRQLKVHYLTAELLPQIKHLLNGSWDREGEQALDLADLYGSNALPRQPPALARLTAIFILEDRARGRHQLTPIAKSRALIALASDNVRRGPAGVPSQQARRFEALAGLVAAVPAWALNVGPDVNTLAPTIVEAIRSRA